MFTQNSPCQIIKTFTGKNHPLLDGWHEEFTCFGHDFLTRSNLGTLSKKLRLSFSTATKHTAANNLKLLRDGQAPRKLCLWCFSCSVAMKDLQKHEAWQKHQESVPSRILTSTRWQVIDWSRDRISSTKVGGHDSPTIQRVMWTHHPKKAF